MDYAALGDPDAPYIVVAKDRARQAQAEKIREWAAQEAAKAPPLSEAQAARIATLFRAGTDERSLKTWRLRLICGHVVERTAHASYPTVERAFQGSAYSCPQCGLSPAVIVAGKPLP